VLDLEEANRQLERANSELRQSEKFLDSLLEYIPAVVFVKDATDLRFVRFNRAGEQLHGHSRNELIGKTDFDFFPREQAEFFTAMDRQTLAGGRIVDIPEEPIDTPDYGRRTLHTRKIPIFNDEGRVAYLLGISEDITERKQADDELRATREEAQRANMAKTEFLSRMSHELRTPLNAILGFSQLLEMDQLSDDQRQDVGHISKAGRHLLELINEVLDISRIESGQMTMSPEPVAIDDLAGELLALVRPLANAARVTMPELHEPCGAYVLADRQRLKQVMLNLLSNAVKYNREGGSITLHCAPSGNTRFRIAITDTGYGIPPAQLDLLFRPFERLGAAQTAVEGTGMGLALSKGFVEAMGGTIGVESQVDFGSTFWIELELAEGPIERYERTNAQSAEELASPPVERVILQIEDNVSSLNLVERILERRPGTQLLVALQGRAGVELARERRPDVILLDLHLPDISGLEVLRLLKAHKETRGIPVVVLSADVDASRTARLTMAGAFGYLTKPLDVASFLEMVDRAVNGDDEVVPS